MSKTAIETALQAEFGGLLATPTPAETWDKAAQAIHDGVIVGTNTNDSAAAGQIGEYARSYQAYGTITPASGASVNVTSIALTAGDWDVSGIVGFYAPGGLTGTNLRCSINTVSATLSNVLGDSEVETPLMPTNAGAVYLSIPNVRVSLAASGTAYLVAKGTFTGGTLGVYGRISARRVR
jgi:hypothetical protein